MTKQTRYIIYVYLTNQIIKARLDVLILRNLK